MLSESHTTPATTTARVDEHQSVMSRYFVPEKICGLDDKDQVNFTVGIGGHHAPPNVRLFSYVLPAIELAQKIGNGRHSLTLATSVNASLAYNYKDTTERQRNNVYWHTREKISYIFAFVQRFFPGVFSETNTYFGDIQDEIHDEVWIKIWNEIKKIRPNICSSFLKGIRREENDETVAYAIRHAFWFLDLIFKDDREYKGDINAAAVSVGSEKEALFNSVRSGVSALPLDFLEKVLGQTILRREKIFRLIFPTENPVPYGEARKGKNGSETSAEVEVLTDQSPFSLDEKLLRDVEYTTKKLKELSDATRDDFQKFLNDLRNLNS